MTHAVGISRRNFLIGLGAAAAATPFAGLVTAGPAFGADWSNGSRVTNIPVFAYHQLDNTPDVESISTDMFASNLAFLHANGYRTITGAQYRAWARGWKVRLPEKPMLITVDDGITNFFANGTPVLKSFGFTAVAFIVTGFADGAAAGNPENVGWNSTWAELRALDPSVWEFAFHAGAQGHALQTYDPANAYFYAARMPGEVDARYQERVITEIRDGRLEFASMLRTKRITNLWAAPWNDVGQPGQPYNGPQGWLEHWASQVFPVVFLQDSARNGVLRERFRFEVQGWMTESYFETTLATYTASGYFNLGAVEVRD